ncbi:hypothetical protein BP5796_00551 [Coleophoma crateriformis]|uniref:Uncharacterized protein n=1 Tax=Coleophoma crateriformis TaxID=565419 RepID=A0A3D8T9U2_9HELO|nr:hypothetical protein BP5796_00551 [Coleophoma crateriformis]
MASKSLQGFSRSLNALRGYIGGYRDPLAQCLAPQLSRSMATEAALPSEVVTGLNNLSLHENSSPASGM